MDLQTTNLWLGVIASVSVIELLGFVIVAYIAMQRVQRVERTVQSLVDDARPLIRRTALALDDLSDVAMRLKRAEDSVTTLVERVSDAGDRVKALAVSRLWPAIGVAKALKAAAATLRARREARERRDRRDRQDAIAEARFVDEGGAYAGAVRR